MVSSSSTSASSLPLSVCIKRANCFLSKATSSGYYKGLDGISFVKKFCGFDLRQCNASRRLNSCECLIFIRARKEKKPSFHDEWHPAIGDWKSFVAHSLTIGLLLLIIGSTGVYDCRIAAAATAEILPAVIEDKMEEFPGIPTVFPPLKEISLPAFNKLILPNGLRVFILEDHESGLVGGQLLIKGGSKDDPVNKVGLALISSIVQRSGGTTAHPAEDLDTKLEEMAARIESSSSVSEMSVGFRCLSEDVEEVMLLFSEVVQHPLMPNDKLELTRSQLLGSIKRRGDNPEGIAAREFTKLMYGNESVYSRYLTADTLKSISQEDLLAFHKATFSPTSAVLGVWGDIDKEAIKELIAQCLGDWNGGFEERNKLTGDNSSKDRSSTILEEVGRSYYKPQIYVVNKPGLNQGFVRMGELGTTIADPDVFALDVLNDILNGFGGLLFDQVRSKEGLAYSVYGSWSPAVEHRGSFVAGGETQIDTVPQFVSSVERVLKSVTETPPSLETLNRAKEGIINSFVFNFVDSGLQLSRLITYDLFGIDQDFLFSYKRRVEALTSDDILEVAKRHLHPESQPILVVADASKLKPVLQSLKREVVNFQPEYLSEQ